MHNKPPFLQHGVKVAITSTARKLSVNEIENGVRALKHHGLEPVISKTIGAEHYIFAGNDNLRLKELQQFINDDEIKAIWLARGGYGTIRIIEAINWSDFLINPKWIIGFSDITNLLATVNNMGLASVHGPMPKTIPKNFEVDVSSNKLFSILKGETSTYQWNNSQHCKAGAAKGQIVGGNLATLSHISPSLSASFFDGKILFIEEVDEYLYQIDRMLRGIKASGKLQKLKGLIVGDFSGLKDNDDPFGESLEDIIHHVFAEFDIPIAFGFKAGHEKENWPLVFGADAQLNMLNEQWELRYI